MENYGEYKACWMDSGMPVEACDWAAVRALHSGEAILEEELEIECFDGSHKVILNSAIPIFGGLPFKCVLRVIKESRSTVL